MIRIDKRAMKKQWFLAAGDNVLMQGHDDGSRIHSFYGTRLVKIFNRVSAQSEDTR